jgi:hypothetical protein
VCCSSAAGCASLLDSSISLGDSAVAGDDDDGADGDSFDSCDDT